MNVSITKIVNIYQYTYKNYNLPIGFGDFLRGCISLLQICNKFNIKYDIYIKTPIFLYLKNSKHNDFIDSICTDVHYYTNQNTNFTDSNLHNLTQYYEYNGYIDKFILFCNDSTLYDDTIYILTNAYPIQAITVEERNQLQLLLEPSDTMLDYIHMTYTTLHVLPYTYDIIHIRSGDEFLVHNQQMNNDKLNNILQSIISHIHHEKQYILLSDNNELNYYISQQYSNIKIIVNDKIHTGKEVYDTDHIKNTLLDFYMISKSNQILSFSVYGHGSSFSKWCAEIYNIPIQAFII
jgi:hypothetical protein